jgi:hypothetical protein
VEGGRFAVKASSNEMIVRFSSGLEQSLCDDETCVLIVGDLKFYAQLLGREHEYSF